MKPSPTPDPRPRLALAAAVFLLTTGLAVPALAQGEEARLLRFPDVHEDFVVFVYGGDVWRAPSAGGEARRLTAHPGQELFPKISHDGRWVAYSAEYSGSRQVWVISADGGSPRQLTFYTDVGQMPPRGGWDYWIQGWTPDGKVLVRMNRTPWGQRMGRYFLVDPAGGLETPLELPEGGSASMSPDGKRLAYTPVSREFRTWKRTRGGRAQDVWIYDLENHRSERLTDDPGTDNFPMWAGETIYFTSDRGEGGDVLNLYAYDLSSRGLRQVTDFDIWDVLWPSLGPGAIVFMNGGRLHRLDLESGETAPIPIHIAGELPLTVPRFEDVSDDIQSADLSPSGVRVVFGARGDLFSVPAEKGPTRNLTGTQGVREHSPAWSPDGRWIAYLSDASGEHELYVQAQDGSGTPRRLTTDGGVWRYDPVWSPDSKKLAFVDQHRYLWVLDVASGELTEVDRGRRHGDLRTFSWSPDSRWLAFQQTPEGAELTAIGVHSLDEGRSFMLGDTLTFDLEPAWSPGGEHLFFISSRDYNMRFSDFEFNYVYDRSQRVYVAGLYPGAPALFPPESDEQKAVTDEEDEDGDGEDGDGEDEEDVEVKVVAEGFGARTVALPGLEEGTYFGLRAAPEAVFYLKLADGADAPALYRYDLAEREEAEVAAGVLDYRLSADGGKVLLQTAAGWAIADAVAATDTSAALDLSGLRMKLDPRAEWRQMFADGWRINRDFFYDAGMHGVDWQALRERYGELVDHVAHRGELDFIFGEMMAELEAGHTYVASGDEPQVERVEGGLLGAELEADAASGRYRIAYVYPGENWHEGYRSPLTEPGVEVTAGDYLLAIDGSELTTDDNPYRLLEGKAGVPVVLKVGAEPSLEEAREVTVVPIANEGNLRYLDWVKSRMEMVERLSDGRVGYIHLPNTALEGNRMLQKLFYGQTEKEALIIDDRYNGGGFIPDRMIEVLERTPLAYWSRRDTRGFRTPGFAHAGPKVMLINGYSASGGDALPYFFRKKGLGKLIGTRTWGGLIGISGAPPLADGGTVLPPTFRIYDAETGEWAVENEGVAPDIEVIDLPEARIAGGDPSLEKGVEVLLEELEAGRGVRWPDPPPAPDMTQ